MSIKKKIDNIIKLSGSISIQDFVELSNFDDEGFYNLDEASKISDKGHFITSPEITPLFGYSIVNQFMQIFKKDSKVHLLELGPGNGTLIKDICNYLSNQNIEISQISILERSVYFKKKVKENFYNNINFLDSLSELSIDKKEVLFVYSNEFFDSLSAKQYIFKNDEFYEIKITKKNDQYKLIHEGSLVSKFLKNYYSEYNFKNGDILEHSNFFINYLEDLKNILERRFFFSATDYGYNRLPKESTLRLISNHKPIGLFDKFENVDYSFGVNFEIINKIFKKFNPILIEQKNLIKTFLPENFKNTKDKNTNKAIELISGKTFSNIGNSFKNISFFSK
tara:strand:+ start:1190 stop:2200 length:1011 start_codon:yes stop_codon:yes gene_type:complete